MLGCFYWAFFFLAKTYGCVLVMDDHHGRTKLGLDPISCPLVLLLSMPLSFSHMAIFYWLGDCIGGVSRWFKIRCSDADAWINPRGPLVALFHFSRRSATWHVLVGSRRFNAQVCRL